MNSNMIHQYPLLQLYCTLDTVLHKGLCSLELLSKSIIPSSSNKVILGEVLFVTKTKSPVKVYYNDNVVSLRNGIVDDIPGAIATLSSDSEPIIVINTSLLKEKQWFIDAMIMHAVGHIVLHFDGCDLSCDMNSILKLITNDKYEYDADEYALANNTDIVNTLLRLNKIGHPNIKHRIFNVEKLCIDYYQKSNEKVSVL